MFIFYNRSILDKLVKEYMWCNIFYFTVLLHFLFIYILLCRSDTCYLTIIKWRTQILDVWLSEHRDSSATIQRDWTVMTSVLSLPFFNAHRWKKDAPTRSLVKYKSLWRANIIIFVLYSPIRISKPVVLMISLILNPLFALLK